jgi:hypothetical protein
VKSIREAHDRERVSTYHQALQSILQKLNPFGHFAKAVDVKLMAFDARSMSNLAYAYTLVGYDPKLDNGNSLLLKVGDRSMTCIKQFKPQELANLLWSFAKTDVPMCSMLLFLRQLVIILLD